MKKEKGKGSKREYLRSFYQGNRLLWLGGMVLTVLVTAGSLAVSWLLKEAVDVIYTQDVEWLFTLIRLGLVLFAVSESMGLLRDWVMNLFLRRAMSQYKSLVFASLSKKSISAFSRENTSRYISVLTNDIATIEEKYLRASFDLVFMILLAVGSAGMLFWYGGVLAWMCIGFSAVPIVLSVIMGREMSRRTTQVSDQNEHFVAQIKDLLSGFAVLKSFKAEPEAAELFDTSNAQTEQVKQHSRWWESIMGVMQESCSYLLQFGVVFAGAYLAIQGQITAGVAVVLINLCGQMINPVAQLPQAIAAWTAARDLVGKTARILEENEAQTGQSIPPVLDRAITVEHLTFGYEPEMPVLKDVSLTLEAGKRYAIVGASGSGKTTLLNLLMGAYGDYTGSIAIDGRELNTLSTESLYDLISLIGQNVFLFDNTIRENITMFRQFPDEAVDSAVERSGLGPVIAAKGEDYRCGENGNGLSGGERQRVSIARSLLRGTPVLMLDEATAALDNQTAWEVTDAILNLDGLTRIVVTHRLEERLLRRYDEILVLRDGCVTEQGAFEELMAKTGYFYSLYNVAN